MIYHSFLEIPQHSRNSDEARTKTCDWILKVIAAIRRLIFYILKFVFWMKSQTNNIVTFDQKFVKLHQLSMIIINRLAQNYRATA